MIIKHPCTECTCPVNEMPGMMCNSCMEQMPTEFERMRAYIANELQRCMSGYIGQTREFTREDALASVKRLMDACCMPPPLDIKAEMGPDGTMWVSWTQPRPIILDITISADGTVGHVSYPEL